MPMEMLAVFDSKNYEGTIKLYEKYGVRGIIIQNGKLAMQCSANGEYKIPGGGMEQGEKLLDTLVREVREETGLLVKAETVLELGEMKEVRRDIFDKKQKYICHSYFYYCEVEAETVPLQLTESEMRKGYHFVWATPEEIIEANEKLGKDAWISRDTAFIRMLADNRFAELGHKF